MNGLIKYMAFCICFFFSFSMTFSRFIHRMQSIFTYSLSLPIVFHCRDHHNYPLISCRCLGCFQFLVIMNKADMSIYIQALCIWFCFSYSRSLSFFLLDLIYLLFLFIVVILQLSPFLPLSSPSSQPQAFSTLLSVSIHWVYHFQSACQLIIWHYLKCLLNKLLKTKSHFTSMERIFRDILWQFYL